MTYSLAASVRRPSMYRMDPMTDSDPPQVDASDDVPARPWWASMDMSSAMTQPMPLSVRAVDTSAVMRQPLPLSVRAANTAAVMRGLPPRSSPASMAAEFFRAKPTPTAAAQSYSRSAGTVSASAPRTSGVVKMISGLLGLGGGHGGGHHGGGHHGGHHGGRGFRGGWGGGWGWGWDYPYAYYDDYYYAPLYYPRTSELQLAVNDVSRMLAREPELVSVTDVYTPDRVLVTVLSNAAANRVRSLVPGSVRGFPVLVAVGPRIVPHAMRGLAGMFGSDLFGGGVPGSSSIVAGPAAVSPLIGSHVAGSIRTNVTIPPRTVAPQPEPMTATVDKGSAVPTPSEPPAEITVEATPVATSSRKWVSWALAGAGIAAAGTIAYFVMRKPKVSANRRRRRR